MNNSFFSILNLYLARKNWQWFIIILCSFSFVIMLFEGIELIRRSMGNFHIDGIVLIEMVLLKVPSHIQKLLPFICFFSSTFCLWRLNQKNEIIAMRANGFSAWQILRALIFFYFILAFFNLLVINPINSIMTQRYKILDESIFGSYSNSKLSIGGSGLWFRENICRKTSIVHTQNFCLRKNLFRNISFYEWSDNGIYKRRIFAEIATLKNQQWHLKHVSFWNKDHEQEQKKNHCIPTYLSLDKIYHSQIEPELMSFWQIKSFIQLLKKSGLAYQSYEMYWHASLGRIGLVLSMVLLACNFTLKPIRYKKVTHMIILGVFLSFLVNFLDDIVYALGHAQKIPVYLAAWFSPLVTAMLGANFLIHQEDNI